MPEIRVMYWFCSAELVSGISCCKFSLFWTKFFFKRYSKTKFWVWLATTPKSAESQSCGFYHSLSSSFLVLLVNFQVEIFVRLESVNTDIWGVIFKKLDHKKLKKKSKAVLECFWPQILIQKVKIGEEKNFHYSKRNPLRETQKHNFEFDWQQLRNRLSLRVSAWIFYLAADSCSGG